MSDRVLKAKREQMWSHVVAQVRQLLRNGAEAAGVIADGNDPDGGGTTYPLIGDAEMWSEHDSDLLCAVCRLSPVTLPIALVVLARTDD